MKSTLCATLLFFSLSIFAENSIDSMVQKCLEFARSGENYKIAHTNQHCLKAAKAGNGPAQYSVGMSYDFEGNSEKEEAYYLKAAHQGVIAAYLALGHFYKEDKPEQALYWYKRHIKAEKCQSGYTAALIADIYKSQGNDEQYKHWHRVSSDAESKPHATCNAGPLINFRPLYPEDAIKQCIEGHVVLKFVVERDLSDEDIKIIESDPPGVFDAAAISNLKKMIPVYIKDGKAGEETTETFNFEIEDDC